MGGLIFLAYAYSSMVPSGVRYPQLGSANANLFWVKGVPDLSPSPWIWTRREKEAEVRRQWLHNTEESPPCFRLVSSARDFSSQDPSSARILGSPTETSISAEPAQRPPYHRYDACADTVRALIIDSRIFLSRKDRRSHFDCAEAFAVGPRTRGPLKMWRNSVEGGHWRQSEPSCRISA